MSILLLTVVIAALKVDPSLITNELINTWALFAIADALWVKIFSGGK